jgi:hypothetical protein
MNLGTRVALMLGANGVRPKTGAVCPEGVLEYGGKRKRHAVFGTFRKAESLETEGKKRRRCCALPDAPQGLRRSVGRIRICVDRE